MSQNTGPVQAKSLSSQLGSGPLGAPPPGEAMFGYSPGAASSATPPPSPYSTANPFASAPADTQEPINRQDRYLRDRFSSDYGGSGMVGRLMTA